MVSSPLSSIIAKDALCAVGLFFIALTILLTFWGPIVVTILYANFDAGDRSAAWIRCKLDHSYLWYEFPASFLASSLAKSALDPKLHGTPAVRISRVCGHILPSALSSYHWKNKMRFQAMHSILWFDIKSYTYDLTGSLV